MKVWRGFTLTVWVIILTLLAVFAMQYRALHTTVLEVDSVKTQLSEAGFTALTAGITLIIASGMWHWWRRGHRA